MCPVNLLEKRKEESVPAEDREFREACAQEEATEESYFDQLAKGLASGTLSRGRALKLLGASVMSTVLVPLVPGMAEASVIRCSNPKCSGGCGGFSNCSCVETTEGARICALQSCSSSGQRCNSSNQCPGNQRCSTTAKGCCGTRHPICVTPCTTNTAGTAAQTASNGGWNSKA